MAKTESYLKFRRGIFAVIKQLSSLKNKIYCKNLFCARGTFFARENKGI
jgi:hypothetical protein